MNEQRMIDKLIKKYSLNQLRSQVMFGEYWYGLVQSYPKGLFKKGEFELYRLALREKELLESI